MEQRSRAEEPCEKCRISPVSSARVRGNPARKGCHAVKNGCGKDPEKASLRLFQNRIFQLRFSRDRPWLLLRDVDLTATRIIFRGNPRITADFGVQGPMQPVRVGPAAIAGQTLEPEVRRECCRPGIQAIHRAALANIRMFDKLDDEFGNRWRARLDDFGLPFRFRCFSAGL